MPNDRQLRLYNSLGRRLEDFASAGGRTGPYSYGPTVYAYPHLGNMRAYVFADTLRRALRWKGIGVRHVVNITDVGHVVADTDTGEDKLEAAAAARPARRWNASQRTGPHPAQRSSRTRACPGRKPRTTSPAMTWALP